jgi:hypothetical protein
MTASMPSLTRSPRTLLSLPTTCSRLGLMANRWRRSRCTAATTLTSLRAAAQ